jgi:hypothetical protein
MLLPTLIAIPRILIWLLTWVDILRRDDIGGGSKALWMVVTFLVPLLGPIVYFIARPGVATRAEREAVFGPDAGSEGTVPAPIETPARRRGPT